MPIFRNGRPKCETCKSRPPDIHPDNLVIYEMYTIAEADVITDSLGRYDLPYTVVRTIVGDFGFDRDEWLSVTEEVREFARKIYLPERKKAKDELAAQEAAQKRRR